MSEPDLSAWIGRTEDKRDHADAGPIRRLAALLDHETPPWAPNVVPPLGHWLYFLPEARQSSLGADGHPTRGGFLPPVALPRRMWAGGRIDFLEPIPFGAEMTRRSTILDVSEKTGASGAMVFVIVLHEIFVGGNLAIREEHDIVYRAAQPPGSAPAKPAAPPPAEEAEFRRVVAPGPVELFRYSALTFNGHRIHYDRDYAVGVEGYPGLIVHGPLIATLLIDNLLRWKPAAPLKRFAYRARSPLFDGARFELCARHTPAGVRVWAQAPGAPVAMEGEATLT
jgi:3-methylfumaryl-CoA hydratase